MKTKVHNLKEEILLKEISDLEISKTTLHKAISKELNTILEYKREITICEEVIKHYKNNIQELRQQIRNKKKELKELK